MRHFVCFVVTLAMAVCLTGCKQEQQQAKAPAPLVSVYKVQAKDVPWPCDFQATAAGSRSAEVRARITGVIQKRLYKEGDYIKAGQLMFQIERDTYEAAYERAKAAFNNAEREWNRVRPLYAANAVSQKERDQALSDYESAKAPGQGEPGLLPGRCSCFRLYLQGIHDRWQPCVQRHAPHQHQPDRSSVHRFFHVRPGIYAQA